MDGSRFDTLARSLSSTGTRRGAFGTLLAGTLGLLGLTETAAEHRQHPHQSHRRNDAKTSAKKRRNVTAEGPCGNGRAKDNACERHAQRCTGYCDKKKGPAVQAAGAGLRARSQLLRHRRSADALPDRTAPDGCRGRACRGRVHPELRRSGMWG